MLVEMRLSQPSCQSFKWNRKNNGQTKWLELGIAGWMFYVTGHDDQGQEINVNDPLADRFKQIRSTCKTSAEKSPH